MKCNNMKNKVNIKSLIIGIFLGSVAVLGIAAATGSGDRTSWEYKVLVGGGSMQVLAETLNNADKEGWEAVGVSYAEGAGTFALVKRARK
jgi:hypothetical protein